VALALLAAIGSDLVNDRCHEPTVASQAGAAQWDADRDSDTDPCDRVCVPDCFCCARSTVAAPLLMPPGVRPIDVLEPPAAPGRQPGVLPLPDPPPLART
jgi:hypothetical protein